MYRILFDAFLWALIIFGFYLQTTLWGIPLDTVATVVFSIFSFVIFLSGLAFSAVYSLYQEGLLKKDVQESLAKEFNITPKLLSYGVLSTIVETIAIVLTGSYVIAFFYIFTSALSFYYYRKLWLEFPNKE